MYICLISLGFSLLCQDFDTKLVVADFWGLKECVFVCVLEFLKGCYLFLPYLAV